MGGPRRRQRPRGLGPSLFVGGSFVMWLNQQSFGSGAPVGWLPPDKMGEIALDSWLHCSLESHVGRSVDDAVQFHREDPVPPGPGTSSGPWARHGLGRLVLSHATIVYHGKNFLFCTSRGVKTQPERPIIDSEWEILPTNHNFV